MIWRRSIAALLAACGFSTGCHSTTAPSPPQPAAPSLTFTATTTASLSRSNNQWQITYRSCFSVQALSAEAAAMIVNRVDYTLLDAAGQVYRGFADGNGFNTGRPVAETKGGCVDFVDPDTVRPVAPTFRASMLLFDSQSTGVIRSLDAAVANNVPPRPFIESVTLTSDIPGSGHILFTRRAITFTVTQVVGGTAPLLYLFKINGFVMRDWGDNPAWVWDAATLNNAPVGNGGFTCAVNVRQGNFPSEASGTTNFSLAFPPATDNTQPLSWARRQFADLGDFRIVTPRDPKRATSGPR